MTVGSSSLSASRRALGWKVWLNAQGCHGWWPTGWRVLRGQIGRQQPAPGYGAGQGQSLSFTGGKVGGAAQEGVRGQGHMQMEKDGIWV